VTAAASLSGRIADLMARADVGVEELRVALMLPDEAAVSDVLAGGRVLEPTELAVVADLLDVPLTVLSGQVPMDGHLGVSLRLGLDAGAGVPAAALEDADLMLRSASLLNSLLGVAESPLADVGMSTDRFALNAGLVSAGRVRRVLGLGDGPVEDLVGLVEGLGYPVGFRRLPDGVHGLNVLDSRGGVPVRVIVVSTERPWTVQRFTLAHELCHALYGDAGQVIVDRLEVPDNRLAEVRAEAFARGLLLPTGPLHADVERMLAGRRAWTDIVAGLMVKWGVSRDATLRALVDDRLASEGALNRARMARVGDLMEGAGLGARWAALSAGEHDESGSPMLVDRAVEAYGRGLVDARVVAELLGRSRDSVEEMLTVRGRPVRA